MRNLLRHWLLSVLYPEKLMQVDQPLTWQDRVRLWPHLQAMVRLKRLERKPREEILAHQLHALNQLVQYAWQKIPFYRSLYQAHAGRWPQKLSWQDFQHLPTVHRENMRAGFPEAFIAPGLDLKTYRLPDRTSGTTGRPFYFWKDLRTAPYEHYSRSIHRLRMGLPYHAVELIVKGHLSDSRKERTLFQKISPYRFRLDGFEVSRHNIRRIADFVNRAKVRLLYGYPSAISNLLHLAQEGALPLSVTHVLTTGEKLSPHLRQIWEKELGLRVSQVYGTAECMHLAYECPLGNGFHVDEQRYVVELKDARPLPGGRSRGLLIVTDLLNYVMPFLRYELGDEVILDHTPCACGCSFTRISAIGARMQDLVITPSGKTLDLRFFLDEILWDSNGMLEQFQIVCQGDKLTVLLKSRNGPLPAALEKNLKADIEHYVDNSMTVELKYSRNFYRSPSGKHKYIVNLDKERNLSSGHSGWCRPEQNIMEG